MAQEIELRIQTEKEDIFVQWLNENALYKTTLIQTDYYLDRHTPPYCYFGSNRDQLDYGLRIRVSNDAFVLCLKKVHQDENGHYLYADEYETQISDLDNTMKIYESMGYYKAITVNKNRQEWEYQDFIIAYDKIDNLGNFFEIELKPSCISYQAGKAKIEDFLKTVLGKDYSVSKGGYPLLLYNLTQNK